MSISTSDSLLECPLCLKFFSLTLPISFFNAWSARNLMPFSFTFSFFRFVSIVIPSSHFSVGWKYPMPSRCTCRPSANSSPIICDSASSTADTSVSVSELRACILWRISSVPTFPLRVMRAWIVFGSV